MIRHDRRDSRRAPSIVFILVFLTAVSAGPA